jgi:CspA family cold shock protein
MATGTIKFFNSERGYGFIEPDDGSADVFVHITDLNMSDFDMLVPNQRVQYDVATNSRNGRAKAIALREPLPEGIWMGART